MASFVLSFFLLDVLDEIWDLIESESERFLTYSYICFEIEIVVISQSLAAEGFPYFLSMLVIFLGYTFIC